ncbi:glycolate oxidase subunit GlcF [Rhizobium sp.]
MQTNFTAEQLLDPKTAEAEAIVRKCVHCGFCTATCPTYVTLGNELDSPRGRIYLIKDMLENGRKADEQVVTHLDRCLSCLACTTTCPSGVDYMHLIDQARVHVEETYKRPVIDRLIRKALTMVLPYPARFRAALRLAKLGRPLAPAFDRVRSLKPLGAMLRLVPASLPAASKSGGRGTFKANLQARARVAILSGCAQSVLDPGINLATVRLLNRLGVEVVASPDEVCCGALVHHMGKESQALVSARRNIDVWLNEKANAGLDAIIITASGCGTTIKDYGHMLKHDPAYAAKAKEISSLAKDVTEFLMTLDLPAQERKDLKVTYHSACSMQHGQKITTAPKLLLQRAGFTVKDPAEGHLCCGSAGTYNILQPEISSTLKERKLKNLKATRPDIIATGNIGCMTQLRPGSPAPIVHTIELLDWAYGGPAPAALNG